MKYLLITIFIKLLLFGCASIDNYKQGVRVDIKKNESYIDKINDITKKTIDIADKMNDNKRKYNIELSAVIISDAIKIIMQEMNQAYIITPDVADSKERIDIVIKKSMSNTDMIQMLKSALNMMGIQMLKRNDIYIISMPIEYKGDKDDVGIYRVITIEEMIPAEIALLLERVLDKHKVPIAYDNQARIIIYKSRDKQEANRIEQIIKSIDRDVGQVFCEIYILETQKEGSLINGLMAYITEKIKDFNIAFRLPQMPVLNMGQFSIINNADTFGAILGILAEENITTVVSRPYLMMMTGQESQLAIGDEVPTMAGYTVKDGVVTNNIVYRSTGIVLTLKAYIVSDNITLSVKVSTSKGEVNKLSNISSPTISKREVVTKVKMKQGQGVILGGLIENRSIHNMSGLPIKNNIVRNYMNRNNRQDISTEMLVYIRPVIVRNNINQINDVYMNEISNDSLKVMVN